MQASHINNKLGEIKLSKMNLCKINLKFNITNGYIVLLAILTASLNVLFFNNYTISMIVITFQLVILAYYFFKNDMTRYIGTYLIFLCLSFEFGGLVGIEHFYGFKNFRILGVNLGIITLLPVVLKGLKKIKPKKLKKEFPKLYNFAKIIIFMNITGLIFGLLLILINDNNIQNMTGMMSSFIGISYSMMAIPLFMIIAISYLVTYEKEKIKLLENYLFAILIAVVVSMIVSFAVGNFGTYGGVETLLVTNIIRYVPFMLIIPFYKHYEVPRFITVFALIGAIFALMYNASGKMIIIYMMAPIAIIIMIWRRKKILPIMLVLLMLPLIVGSGFFIIDVFANHSILFTSKLNQALAISRFWDSNWLFNMPASPRIRIIEFINIAYEYLEKPWFLFFGKGYMGTIVDHTGMLGITLDKFDLGAYSLNQWMNGTFYKVHETFNLLFLYNGLFGLIFYLFMIKFIFKYFTKSPWVLIGGFWFLMVYGYSVTMSAFGVTALLLGYIAVDTREGFI